MSDKRAIHLVSYAQDPLETLLDLVFRRHAAELPDFSHITILLPHLGVAPRFHRLLIDRAAAAGHTALLPPSVLTLAVWVQQFARATNRVVGDNARELIMYDALRKFPGLTETFGTWPLIDSLFKLFDELTFEQFEFSEDPTVFRNSLTSGYGLRDDASTLVDDETTLVHALWIAWRRELADRHMFDSSWLTIHGMAQSLKQPSREKNLFVVGPIRGSRVECDWIDGLLDQDAITLILQGQAGGRGYHPDAPITRLLNRFGDNLPGVCSSEPYTAFLNSVYAELDTNIRQRAEDLAANVPMNLIKTRLTVHKAADLEDEARSIDVQVRRWIALGLRNIGIVTADRKLARRARALLERAEVHLRDAGGWALSTTSAATALARWLECLDHNFYHQIFLDVLKSPFLRLPRRQLNLRAAIDVLENEVFLRLNVSAGLKNYRREAAELGRTSPRYIGHEGLHDLLEILEWFEEAVRPIDGINDGKSHSSRTHLGALLASINRLGMPAEFAEDEAGEQLLGILDELRLATVHHPIDMRWNEFCQWLRRELERRNFRPHLSGAGVELMGITESRLYRFDAVFIAGCTNDHLPGPWNGSVFFNDRVRRTLGLPDREQRYSEQLHDFRRLLEAGKHIVVSFRDTDRGEPTQPSPWVERLDAFCRIAYGHELRDASLTTLAQSPETLLVDDRAQRPHPETNPAVRIPSQLIPSRISASAFQRLLDCPYQFYAIHCLGLVVHEQLSDDLEKSQFGERVHKILQAFHEGISKLPGPWRTPLKLENASNAEELLGRIAREVFSRDLTRNYSARAWLNRWLNIVPHYIEWELKHAQSWHHVSGEVVRERRLQAGPDSVTLSGRIDRLLRGPAGHVIVDFKTGMAPDKEVIASGEHAQLPFYASLFDEPIDEALFVHLYPTGIVDRHRLSGQQLEDLTIALRARLLGLINAMHHGVPLPAWGDIETCRRCPAEGLCRKSFWMEHGENKKAAFRPPTFGNT